MKQLIFLFLLFISSFTYGQCADEDTVRSNTVSLITFNSARINGSITHFTSPGTVTAINLVYVRAGQTDTATSTGGPTSTLRNLTGLQANTQYYYYYSTVCGGSSNNQLGTYTFTTVSNTVGYTPESHRSFPYVKIDSGFAIPFRDTTIGRGIDRPGPMVINTADSLPYYYNGVSWAPVYVDSAGVIDLINMKVDSVTLSSDTLYYWIGGVSYGQVFFAVTDASNGVYLDGKTVKLGTNPLTENTNIETSSYKLESTGKIGKRQFVLDPSNNYWAIGDVDGDFGNATSIHIADSIGEVRVNGALKIQELKTETPYGSLPDIYNEFPVFYSESDEYLHTGTGVDSMWRDTDSIYFRIRSANTAKSGVFGLVSPILTPYTIKVQALTSSPADAGTTYFGMLPKAPTTTANTSKVYIRTAGTITAAEIYCYSGTTAGTNESWSLYIRHNNTTDYLIATVSASTSERVFSNTGLSIAVSAGDYIEIKSIQPTWATNPLATIYGGYIKLN